MSRKNGLKICEEMQGLHNWASKKKRTQKRPDHEFELERFETVIRCRNCGYEQMIIESKVHIDDDDLFLTSSPDEVEG